MNNKMEALQNLACNNIKGINKQNIINRIETFVFH